jgi:hypothetical protein
MEKQSLRERFMLEGAIGYIVNLFQQIDQGNLKTVEEIKGKLSEDGERASGALSCHLEAALKTAGFATGFLDDDVKQQKEAEAAIA